MVSNINNFNIFSYSSSAGAHGKLKLPVQPRFVVFSQLEHISGVAARPNQKGININKIQVLNSLIHHLTTAKQTPSQEFINEIVDEKYVDTLIRDFSEQIKASISQAESTIFAVPTVPVQTGVIFSIAV
jgi:hypothetical protein